MNPEQAAFVAQMFIQNAEREYKTTRRVLGAVPEEKKDYIPCANSRSAFDLASHIATSEVWFLESIAKGSFAWGGEPPKFESVAQLVTFYETSFPEALARVKAMPAEKLAEMVEAFGSKLPAVTYLAFMNSHSVHHRGQLAAYLRPMGAKVPNIYGGSYDEPMQMPANA